MSSQAAKENPTQVYAFPFSKDGAASLSQMVFGKNWPVVYLIHNASECYVGETSNAYIRMKNHLENKEREKLETMEILYNQRFNKSVILDLEATLISMMSADRKYVLQNRNSGQSMAHNYYQKAWYDSDFFPEVWEQLLKKELAQSSFYEIQNSDLFKFSPYHTLTEEQFETAHDIISSLLELEAPIAPNERKKEQTYLIKGGPGTGKSVLAVYLFKTLYDMIHSPDDVLDMDEGMSLLYGAVERLRSSEDEFKMGLVIPQSALRRTLKSVFAQTRGLKSSMVIGPSEVVGKHYSLLIVDEGHRLKRRKALTGYGSFDKTNEKLELGHEGTELDWIMKSSRYQILIYDAGQSVKTSDVEADKFKELFHQKTTQIYTLESQMRVLAGKDYIEYIGRIFSADPPAHRENFGENYVLEMYENLQAMINEIKMYERTWGLSRMTAGYAWEWKTKKLVKQAGGVGAFYALPMEQQAFDFVLDGVSLRWNTVADDWVNSLHAQEEVGCIHTIQGYDLNYAGVIIGPDLQYDPRTKRIVFHPECFYDKKMKDKTIDLTEYVLNTYKVLLTRGIRGTLVYVCDPDLRDYLRQYIKVHQEAE